MKVDGRRYSFHVKEVRALLAFVPGDREATRGRDGAREWMRGIVLDPSRNRAWAVGPHAVVETIAEAGFACGTGSAPAVLWPALIVEWALREAKAKRADRIVVEAKPEALPPIEDGTFRAIDIIPGRGSLEANAHARLRARSAAF